MAMSSTVSVASMEKWGIPYANQPSPKIALLERLVWVRYQSHWWPALLYLSYTELQQHLYNQLDTVLKAQFAMAIMRHLQEKRQVKVARLLGRKILEVIEVEEDCYCEFYWQLPNVLPKACDIGRYSDINLFFDFHRAMDQVEEVIKEVANENDFALLPTMEHKTWIERARAIALDAGEEGFVIDDDVSSLMLNSVEHSGNSHKNGMDHSKQARSSHAFVNQGASPVATDLFNKNGLATDPQGTWQQQAADSEATIAVKPQVGQNNTNVYSGREASAFAPVAGFGAAAAASTQRQGLTTSNGGNSNRFSRSTRHIHGGSRNRSRKAEDSASVKSMPPRPSGKPIFRHSFMSTGAVDRNTAPTPTPPADTEAASKTAAGAVAGTVVIAGVAAAAAAAATVATTSDNTADSTAASTSTVGAISGSVTSGASVKSSASKKSVRENSVCEKSTGVSVTASPEAVEARSKKAEDTAPVPAATAASVEKESANEDASMKSTASISSKKEGAVVATVATAAVITAAAAAAVVATTSNKDNKEATAADENKQEPAADKPETEEVMSSNKSVASVSKSIKSAKSVKSIKSSKSIKTAASVKSIKSAASAKSAANKSVKTTNSKRSIKGSAKKAASSAKSGSLGSHPSEDTDKMNNTSVKSSNTKRNAVSGVAMYKAVAKAKSKRVSQMKSEARDPPANRSASPSVELLPGLEGDDILPGLSARARTARKSWRNVWAQMTNSRDEQESEARDMTTTPEPEAAVEIPTPVVEAPPPVVVEKKEMATELATPMKRAPMMVEQPEEDEPQVELSFWQRLTSCGPTE